MLDVEASMPTANHGKARSRTTRRGYVLILTVCAALFVLVVRSNLPKHTKSYLIQHAPNGKTSPLSWIQAHGIHHKSVKPTMPVEPPARIIKATIAYGKGAMFDEGTTQGMDLWRERTLKTHYEHAALHGYRQVVQRVDSMGSIYTKPATVLNLLLEELSKPESQRAEWIFVHDADVVIMNRQMRIETFLPPKDKDVNLLVTYDGNGLNSGVFIIRVCAWAVQLIGGNIAYPALPNTREYSHSDQGAMGNLLEDSETFRSKTVVVPQRWINAYPTGWSEGAFEEGDMLVHLVWLAKKDTQKWVEKSERLLPQLNVSPQQSGMQRWVDEFWMQH